MEEQLNLPLRMEVLHIALNLEKNINQILALLLNLPSSHAKTIGHKSGGLSFKNKIDLLYDLSLIDKKEHDKLLLLMEYRNQFMHNIECNSFVAAAEALGIDKKRRLTEYSDLDDKYGEEAKLDNGYQKLNIISLQLMREKLAWIRVQCEDQLRRMTSLIEYSTHIVDKLFDIYTEALRKFEPTETDPPEVVLPRSEILIFIGQEICNLTESDEFKKLQNNMSESFRPEVMKKLARINTAAFSRD